jgi:phage replication initiation protein
MITHKQGTAGDTFYVGSRQSGKLFRCYEKGKQLGDANSTWVRYELELLHKDRVIPWEALLLPLQYLKGSYPKAFSWMAATSRCIKTVKESARITFERMQRFAKQQCGRLVRYMRDVAGMDESEIVGVLSADIGRYPLRLWDAARDSVLPWSTANRVSSPLPAF